MQLKIQLQDKDKRSAWLVW